MVLPIWQATIVNASGDVQDGAEITVQREAPGLPMAVLYSDREGNTLADNPVVTDANGYGYFYADPGLYRITATKGGFSRTWVDVSIEVLGSSPDTAQLIEDGYNSQVDQVDAAERVAGTETEVRRFAPADVASMAAQHGGLPKTRVVAVSNVAIATELEDGDTLDGVTLAEGDIVLLTGQTAPAENGLYIVVAATAGAASRHPAFSSFDECAGTYFSVMEGDDYHDTLFVCTSNRGGTIDSDPLVFVSFGPITFARIATTSGSSQNQTGIPAWVRHIKIDFDQVRTNGTSSVLLQIGPSGGVETSDYECAAVRFSTSGILGGTFTNAFHLLRSNASDTYSGSIELSLVDESTNTWVISGSVGGAGNNIKFDVVGRKALSGVLERLELSTANTFNNGGFRVTIQYSA